MYYKYDEFEEKPTGGDLAKLSKLADEAADLQRALECKTKETETIQARLTEVLEKTIPELMTALGVKEFKTSSDLEIKLKKIVGANISEANKEAAFAWLEANGHGGMIRRNVVVEFTKEQHEAAKDLVASLRKDYPMAYEEGAIHASTLKSWATKRYEAGEAFPESISTFPKTVAVIK